MNYTQSISIARNNQLNDYLNRSEEPEELENPCCYCENEAEILETYSPRNMIGTYEDLVCRDCRKVHIKANNGIRGYYKNFNIQSVELI